MKSGENVGYDILFVKLIVFIILLEGFIYGFVFL